MSSAYFNILNLSSSFLSKISSAKAALDGSTFSLLKTVLAVLRSLFLSSFFKRNLIFLYFFDIFLIAKSGSLFVFRLFLFSGNLKSSTYNSGIFVAACLFLNFLYLSLVFFADIFKFLFYFTSSRLRSSA